MQGYASYRPTFNLAAVAATYVPFLLLALGLGVGAEFIGLALAVEDHLANIRFLQERSQRPSAPQPQPYEGHRESGDPCALFQTNTLSDVDSRLRGVGIGGAGVVAPWTNLPSLE